VTTKTIDSPTLADALVAMALADIDDCPPGRKFRDHTNDAVWSTLRALTPHMSDEQAAGWWDELKKWVEARRYEEDTGRRRFTDEGVDIDDRIDEAIEFLTGRRGAWLR
jgi:hypothetical protein